MFGIGKMKERLHSLTNNVHELFNREHSNRAHVEALSKRVSNIYKTVGEIAATMTSERADELAVAIAKCSADMAELDRRLCALENAITIVPNRKYAAARSEQVTLDDDGIDELAKVFEKASWGDKHLNGDPAQQPLELSRKKKYVQRIESATVAATIVATDKDAARIVEGLKRRCIHQRIIDACIAAGVVDATRNKRDIVVREKRRHGNRRYYNASIRCYGDHSRDIGFLTALEASHCMREMKLVVRYVAEYFATGMVFDEGKPNGGKP